MISCPDHKPKQHRDRRPAWCPNCGLTKDGKIPQVPQPEVVTNPQTFPEPEGYDAWDQERKPVEPGYQGATRT